MPNHHICLALFESECIHHTAFVQLVKHRPIARAQLSHVAVQTNSSCDKQHSYDTAWTTQHIGFLEHSCCCAVGSIWLLWEQPWGQAFKPQHTEAAPQEWCPSSRTCSASSSVALLLMKPRRHPIRSVHCTLSPLNYCHHQLAHCKHTYLPC